MRHLIGTISALALCACATTASQGGAAEGGTPAEGSEERVYATISTQDGTSFEHAVVIEAASEREGGELESRWVTERYPRYRVKKQSVIKLQQRQYAVLEIVDGLGEEHSLYFDITSFYGKK